MNGLMICNRVRLPYRVMRCMAEAGVSVIVLGNERSKGLAHSRYCKRFILSSQSFDGSFGPEMADEINLYIHQYKVDIVFPGDAPSSRTFAGLRPFIKATCFPGPDIYQFDLLNDKWEFAKLCDEEGILRPKTWRFEDRDALTAHLAVEPDGFPYIAKPLNLDGENGVIKLNRDSLERDLAGVVYSPILLQQFIEGYDVGASMFCEGGEIKTFIAHRLDRGVYKTFEGGQIREPMARIAARFKLNGVYNFDLRAAADGRLYFLECNPRFFFKMCLSLIAGINFVRPGLHPDKPPYLRQLDKPTSTRTPRAWPQAVVKPWTLSPWDRANLRFLLSDPVSFVREQSRLDWD